MTIRTAVLILLTLGFNIIPASAAKKALDISAEANNTWCGQPMILNCATFPTGKQVYNGMTFNIPTTNNAWFAATASNQGNGQVSITIPVNVANVKTVYTLMNTIWGQTQPGLLSVTFTGSGGATWTYNPLGNVDVRDHNQDGWTNNIACHIPGGTGKAATVNAWTNGQGQRLDMQIFELPASFRNQTLVSITITDNGAPNFQRSFVAAVTVSTALP